MNVALLLSKTDYSSERVINWEDSKCQMITEYRSCLAFEPATPQTWSKNWPLSYRTMSISCYRLSLHIVLCSWVFPKILTGWFYLLQFFMFISSHKLRVEQIAGSAKDARLRRSRCYEPWGNKPLRLPLHPHPSQLFPWSAQETNFRTVLVNRLLLLHFLICGF